MSNRIANCDKCSNARIQILVTNLYFIYDPNKVSNAMDTNGEGNI